MVHANHELGGSYWSSQVWYILTMNQVEVTGASSMVHRNHEPGGSYWSSM